MIMNGLLDMSTLYPWASSRHISGKPLMPISQLLCDTLKSAFKLPNQLVSTLKVTFNLNTFDAFKNHFDIL